MKAKSIVLLISILALSFLCILIIDSEFWRKPAPSKQSAPVNRVGKATQSKPQNRLKKKKVLSASEKLKKLEESEQEFWKQYTDDGYRVLDVTESRGWLRKHPNVEPAHGKFGKVVVDGAIIQNFNYSPRVLLPTKNELTPAEIDKATEIKTWLKKNGYTVRKGTLSKNGDPRVGLGGALILHGPVTQMDMKNGKVKLTIENIGSATFTIDANGELQPAK